jgi:hypothetical protein
MKIEIFRTDVSDERQAQQLKEMLHLHFPSSRINFDLADCDKVLRIEGADFTIEKVLLLVSGRGVACTILD